MGTNRKKVLARLPETAQNHLGRLILNINMLADISFADVLVVAPKGVKTRDSEDFYVLGHARPINSSTVYNEDTVDSIFRTRDHPLLAKTHETGQIQDGGVFSPDQNCWIESLAVPINFEGNIIGVMLCEKYPLEARDPGQLEASYISAFRRLAQMVTDGSYPFPQETLEHDNLPRVGDGLMVLNAESNAEYISPNGHSALRRIGIILDPANNSVDTTQLPAISTTLKTRLPHTEEVEANDNTVISRCLPLLEGDQLTGALVLLRDITELRRRDRLLLTKDATIAEIHHRVKNNLQTISSLLQLQSRRLEIPEARFAILESARRIRSIAVVHEILAHETTGEIEYGEILKSLVAEIREALISPEIPIQLKIRGSAGIISSNMASSLALVMSELIQNAIDHAFLDGTEEDPRIVIDFQRLKDRFEITISDNGVGIPSNFSVDESPGLGLTIVRTLMEADLRGTIQITKPKKGTAVQLQFPLPTANNFFRN